jgi:hypothetical protein
MQAAPPFAAAVVRVYSSWPHVLQVLTAAADSTQFT